MAEKLSEGLVIVSSVLDCLCSHLLSALISELVNLKMDDVHMDEGYLKVMGTALLIFVDIIER